MSPWIRSTHGVARAGCWGVLLVVLSGCSSPTRQTDEAVFERGGRRPIYPFSPTQEVVETYHGVEVADPYRWLENDWAVATEAWVAAQNRLTQALLSQIPERAWIHDRLSRLWGMERQGLPVFRGARLFYLRNDGRQPQSTLWWSEGADAEPRLLCDPNAPSYGRAAAVAAFEPNADGSRVAYGLRTRGSSGETWRVYDVDSGRDLPDEVLVASPSSVAWKRDGGGFFYTRSHEPTDAVGQPPVQAPSSRLCYHRLGTSQNDDAVILHRAEHSDWTLFPRVTDDGRYLVILVAAGADARNGVLVLDLSRADLEVQDLLIDFDAGYRFVGNDGERFLFQSDAGAPLGRLIAVDLHRPERAAWEEVVPEGEDTLEAVTRVGEHLVLRYLHNAVSRMVVVDRQGRPVSEIPMPGLGSVTGVSGSVEGRDAFFSYTSFTTPPTVYRFDAERAVVKAWHLPRVAFDPQTFETRQVFYRSPDGTPVPMFLTQRKGLGMDGDRPTLLQGYGGFGVSMKPRFSVAQLVWMEMGGVYAVPNLRGGGEFGEAWHQGGVGVRKQRVFDDFIAAAEWLIANQVTNPRRLAIMGGSNGGLVVGACMTQRPGLFAVALPSDGVFDLLRFAQFTIGWAWVPEYGDVTDPEAFRVLRSSSPLHNIHEGTVYPSTLLTAAAHDQRVVPGHSFKFTAALQASHVGDNPILIRVRTRPEAGVEDGTNPVLEETADQLAFAVKELGMAVPPPDSVASGGF